ncbi:hypothetical protein GF357_03900 [Candidatus Dojkabacteria bacterium]|nr:hypothetical protein [Candidatus Dojkabacteria bacterium]
MTRYYREVDEISQRPGSINIFSESDPLFEADVTSAVATVAFALSKLREQHGRPEVAFDPELVSQCKDHIDILGDPEKFVGFIIYAYDTYRNFSDLGRFALQARAQLINSPRRDKLKASLLEFLTVGCQYIEKGLLEYDFFHQCFEEIAMEFCLLKGVKVDGFPNVGHGSFRDWFLDLFNVLDGYRPQVRDVVHPQRPGAMFCMN